MARYEIIHACGHAENTQIYGPMRERQGKADWLASRDCAECYQRKLQQQRAEASTRAAAQSAAAGLPALSGSDKQIAWAETLRCDNLRGIPNMLRLRERVQTHDIPGARAETMTALRTATLDAIDALMRRASAHEWIETRSSEPFDLVSKSPEVARLMNVVRAEIKGSKQQEVIA